MRAAPLVLVLSGCAAGGVWEEREQLTSVIHETSGIREVTDEREIARLLAVVPRSPRGAACNPLDWPVEALVSSGFGPRAGQPHEGIDLQVPSGSPVRAACDGVVVYAGEKLRGYGLLVIVQHGDGLATVYAHNSLLMVQEGERVRRGQDIARSGATGRVTAPHLHFEVRRDNRPDDPLKYLPPRARPTDRMEARRGELYGSAHRPDRRTNP